MNMSEQSLTLRTYFGYGLLYLPLALLAITFYVYVPKFYSDVVGVELGAITLIIVLSRVWDAIIDPAIGYVSDRTTTRWGRRRPWIICASLPLALAFSCTLLPQLRPEAVSATMWLAVSTTLFFLFWTMVSVPYEALGAEITFDFHCKTKLLGVRDGLGVLGTLFAGAIPVLLASKLIGLDELGQFRLLAVGYSLLLVAAALLCAWAIRERQWTAQQRPSTSLRKAIAEALSNRPFRILLIAYTVSAFGAGLPATLIPYYVEYVLGSKQFSLFLTIYFLVGFLCLPVWVVLAKKLGKKEAWIAAMLINTGAFAGVFFLGRGDLLAYGVLVGCSALGYGATLAIPSSMQTDVIDFDEMMHGTRREGQFIGFWSIAKKLAAALGAGAALSALDFSGYTPNVVQSESTEFALRFLYAAVPCICNFLAIALAWKYPIDSEMHRDIRQKIDARAAL